MSMVVVWTVFVIWTMLVFTFFGTRRHRFVILLEVLEFFKLFLGENFIEFLHAVNSVVEQRFLCLENFCLGCGNFLVIVAVECFVQGSLGIFLLLAEFLERGIRSYAKLFKGGFLFVCDLED